MNFFKFTILILAYLDFEFMRLIVGWVLYTKNILLTINYVIARQYREYDDFLIGRGLWDPGDRFKNSFLIFFYRIR